jgi:hypothetical protein
MMVQNACINVPQKQGLGGFLFRDNNRGVLPVPHRAIISDNDVRGPKSHHEVYGFFKVVVPSQFVIGLASIHLVNFVTVTRGCVNPHITIASFPTISSPQITNGQMVGMVFISSPGTWGCLS